MNESKIANDSMGKIDISSLRKLAGIFLVLILLCIFLCLYFLKYIPSEQINFHHSSFLELKQFESALQERNEAYEKAIENFLRSGDFYRRKVDSTVGLSAIAKRFNYIEYFPNPETDISPKPAKTGFKPNTSYKYQKNSNRPDTPFKLLKVCLVKDPLTNKWELEYRVSCKNDSPVAGFRKNVDTLVSGLVSSYRDIFDDYLIIRDTHLNKTETIPGERSDENLPDSSDHLHDGEIIYNSGNLSVDYLVNTDSLLKKNEGFSLVNIHDVIIEGNSYKLFLYPIRLGQERLILAGLIGLDRYHAQFRKIPFTLIAFVGVLILLVLINLPILKIYNLGPYERVNDLDIRLLIGTYFVSAFIGFFLFTNSFLNHTEKLKTRSQLEEFASKIKNNFVSEIDSICVQLQDFDNRFLLQNHNDCGNTLQKMKRYNYPDLSSREGIAEIDNLFTPTTYPYLNNVFWINSNGVWTTGWGFKKNYRYLSVLNVSDRPYYRDFINKKYLKLPGGPCFTKGFTIQPTLSKLDGEYTINVLIQSQSDKLDTPWYGTQSDTLKPLMIGLSTDMNFISNAIPQAGFNFCIINEGGDVLYDSKPGRALLSNILRVVDKPTDLYQCARYRSEKYFDAIMLRGRQVSMLSIPVKGFPYTLLVYYKVADTEDIHVHLIAVTATIMVAILLLLLLSSLINEWTAKTQILLRFPRLHFEWLYPDRTKYGYYIHLIRWMSAFLSFLVLWWGLIELLYHAYPHLEFSLFFVAILFPFFMAMHYFLIREKNNQIHASDKSGQSAWPPPSRWLYGFLGLVIILISGYGFHAGFSWEILVPELCLGGLISISMYKLKGPDPAKGSAESQRNILNPFSIAVLLGIFLISIIPAMGVFIILLKQETSLQSAFSQIEMTRQINTRRIVYNQRIKEDSAFILENYPSKTYQDSLKFSYGIYTSGNLQAKIEPNPIPDTMSVELVAPGYLRFHNYFFPESGISDNIDSAFTDLDGKASYFLVDDKITNRNTEFIYQNEQDGMNKSLIGQQRRGDDLLSATRLLFSDMFGTDRFYVSIHFFLILLCLLVPLFLTRSLAARIFLLNFTNWKFDPNLYVFHEKNILERYPVLKSRLGSNPHLSILEYEENCHLQGNEEGIIWIEKILATVYQAIWDNLNDREKYMLYDFATDGFTNYKNGAVIYELIRKGILLFREDRLRMMTLSFREFVLSKPKDPAIKIMGEHARKLDSWKNIKIPLLIILSTLGLFIFFTQDLIYQKITGLLTSIGTLVPLLVSLLPKNNQP